MKSIQQGDQAPDLTLNGQDGKPIALAEYRGRNVVVLFFYPSDGTPVCTREACAFRDAYEEFVRAGAVVIGVSSDSIESHRDFAARHELPFMLASDPNGAAREAFGVPKTMFVMPGRVTYVIDREGVVRLVFNAQMQADRHVAEALKAVQKLVEQPGA